MVYSSKNLLKNNGKNKTGLLGLCIFGSLDFPFKIHQLKLKNKVKGYMKFENLFDFHFLYLKK